MAKCILLGSQSLTGQIALILSISAIVLMAGQMVFGQSLKTDTRLATDITFVSSLPRQTFVIVLGVVAARLAV